MEGDSQLTLNIAIKLQNGTNYTKVSPSWRLNYDVQQLALLIYEPSYITFQRVWRETNSLVDKLAN